MDKKTTLQVSEKQWKVARDCININV